MGLVGADLERLRSLVAQLSGPMQTDLNGVLAEMNDEVQASATYWVAEDGDKFRTSFAAFVTSTKTQLDDRLATAAKISGQNLQAIGTATGNATGQRITSGQGQDSLVKPLSYYWTKNFLPQWGNLWPLQHPIRLLSGESRSLTVGAARFLMYRYDGSGFRITIGPGEVPDDVFMTATRLGAANVVAGIIYQGIQSYQEDEEAHPTWSRGELLAEAFAQGTVIGGISGVSAFAAGWNSAGLANQIGTWAGTKVSPKFADYVANQAEAAETGTEEETGTEASAQAEAAAETAEEATVEAAAEATAETAAETTAEAQGLALAQAWAKATAQELAKAGQASAEALTESAQVSADGFAEATEASANALTEATGTAATTAETAGAGTAAETTAEAGTDATVEAGTDVAVEAGTDVAVEAEAETAGEMLATIGTDTLIGAALGSEVPILGNVVGLVIGFAVGTIISFAAGKLGTAVGHAVWDAGGDAVHEADHIFHDLF
jgi:hypothetical protein